MTHLIIAAVAGDHDSVNVTVDPAGRVAQLVELLADDQAVHHAFDSAVVAAEMLRKPHLDEVTRDYWEHRRSSHLATLGESAAIHSALTAVLTVPQGTDLNNALDDAVDQAIRDRDATTEGENLYSLGLDDEPDRDGFYDDERAS